jgi:[acyl-carrier-protein] S-malonyltransferase
VRWVDVVLGLKARGATHVIEFGPGKVLSGLVSRIDKSLKVSAVFDPPSLETALRDIA